MDETTNSSPRSDIPETEADQLAQIVKVRFDAVDKRFDAVDERLSGVDERLDGMDERFNTIDSTLRKVLRLQEQTLELAQNADAKAKSPSDLDDRVKRLEDAVFEPGRRKPVAA